MPRDSQVLSLSGGRLISPPAALILDLDGTLLDSRPLILACLQEVVNGTHKQKYSDEHLLSGVGLPLKEVMKRLVPHDHETAAKDYTAHYYSLKQDERMIHAFPGIRSMLEHMANRGVALAVATSKRHDPAVHDLEVSGLSDLIPVVVGPDDVERPKPSADPLLQAAALLGVDPKASWYLGDSPYDIQAAHAAQMGSIAALWGGMFKEETLIKESPHKMADSPSEVVNLAQ